MSKRSLAAADLPSASKKAKMSSALTNGSSHRPQSGEIDEDLHSRQLAVYGRDSMRRLAASQVLVIGLDGLGVEVGALMACVTCRCIQRDTCRTFADHILDALRCS